MELSSPKTKKSFYISGEIFQSLKIKNFKFFCFLRENISNIRAKEKRLAYFPLQ